MNTEEPNQEPPQVPLSYKSNIRKVVVFLVTVTLLTTLYQIMMFQYVLPGRAVTWHRGSLELLQSLTEQRRRVAVLVMLEADIQDEDEPLDVFKDPAVREEFNRLRLAPILIPIQSGDADHQEWMRQQGFEKLPGLLLYVRADRSPIQLNADDLAPRDLAKTLHDLRFERYEPDSK